ncbi:hypothetical protein EVAR_99498_1 [Eumeta japonica]|uniref:Uncharacterized protein n=1 Tax=Eumeta variegata TaxID=151549 RepID=A0A4C1Z1Y6_EUMVA|nr:hypothetical protein EVAR_99498_1 [Eumeta japonica]
MEAGLRRGMGGAEWVRSGGGVYPGRDGRHTRSRAQLRLRQAPLLTRITDDIDFVQAQEIREQKCSLAAFDTGITKSTFHRDKPTLTRRKWIASPPRQNPMSTIFHARLTSLCHVQSSPTAYQVDGSCQTFQIRLVVNRGRAVSARVSFSSPGGQRRRFERSPWERR